ncbi:helix-turn-helix transcriptional regulator [Pantoea agglomerans]|uniref:helix-turn-helix transcriptional regulator n=1 Tax=Enterobacter agglomerans TaxID=549 RepID=UPI00104DAE1E|nr:helix-turn-helix transcriptional regulator [Pantoea agglomerans]MBD8144405.1 helix-turn-helix transcriptional regulator [Pantoea agglomerans]MBD8181624.1 helix-turn-helix transcriptional regulator [Pantoea agglomerans]MBD8222318.1 helix-turn-helix transcriptional regulator [Pantoea agglomerans]MCX2193649.1 helix-turn-helix transcriptional regulator [Pantoea agglomerans]MDY0998686.1 helix-turn-helix transcriptional regulator [Pantoea agglomerans]
MDNTQRCMSFTENEVAVTWFFMTGMTLKQIAEWLGLTEKSVSYYKRRVMRKIGVKNNNEFIMWYLGNRSIYQGSAAEFSILRRSVPDSRNQQVRD